MVKKRVRATPMAPEERRAAIVAATIPLLRSRGWLVTTKEIASASGVAEGTIFTVFQDKEELLVAALEAAVDPQPTIEALEAIDVELPLDQRLVMAVDVVQDRIRATWELGTIFSLEEVRKRKLSSSYGADFLMAPVAALFDPTRDRLAVSPEVAARALIALAVAGSNLVFQEAPLTRGEVVTLMLDGIRLPAGVRVSDGAQPGDASVRRSRRRASATP